MKLDEAFAIYCHQVAVKTWTKPHLQQALYQSLLSADDIRKAFEAGAAHNQDTAAERIEAAIVEMLDTIDRHLDAEVSPRYKEQPLAQDWARVAKCGEEAGEALDALILYTEQNPRKVQRGDTATLDDVLGELADTSITAMLGITHFTKDARRTRFIVQQKLIDTYQRIAAYDKAAADAPHI